MQEQEHYEKERGEAASEQDEDVKCSNELLAKMRERMAQRRALARGEKETAIEDTKMDDSGQ